MLAKLLGILAASLFTASQSFAMANRASFCVVGAIELLPGKFTTRCESVKIGAISKIV